jgi:succinate-acetate transporter protein
MRERSKWSAFPVFSVAIAFLLGGLKLLLTGNAILGEHRDKSLNVIGGWLLILVSLICLYTTYHSLSPYGKIRSFFEGRVERKIRKK